MKKLISFYAVWMSLLSVAAALPSAQAESVRRPGLIKPRKELFSHKNHTKAFTQMGVSCLDCHTFSVKPEQPGPTAPAVTQKLLKPAAGICHQCHMGKVQMPLRNQCLLCHQELDAIKPADHNQAWNLRHGKLAQQDRDSCTACHKSQDCTSCHQKQNTLRPMVHRPNFRMMHSIQARSDAQSCSFCHKTASFCIDCHSGRKTR